MILIPMSDAAMGGMICKVTIEANGDIIGGINKEHEWVSEALMKPVNRKALTYVVARELAAELAINEVIRKKLFKKPALLRLIEEKDDQTRERFMARLLLDRAA